MVRRLVRVLITLGVAWVIGLVAAILGSSTTAAAASPETSVATSYTCDHHQHHALATDTADERRPPSYTYIDSASNAGSTWWCGASRRLYAAVTSAPQSDTTAAEPGGQGAGFTRHHVRPTDGALFSLGQTGVAAKTAGKASPFVTRTVADARAWLGPGGRAITNDAGDKICLSQNGLRRIRVDINRPYPHEFGHAHVEELIDAKWVRSGPIYPSDVPGR